MYLILLGTTVIILSGCHLEQSLCLKMFYMLKKAEITAFLCCPLFIFFCDLCFQLWNWLWVNTFKTEALLSEQSCVGSTLLMTPWRAFGFSQGFSETKFTVSKRCNCTITMKLPLNLFFKKRLKSQKKQLVTIRPHTIRLICMKQKTLNYTFYNTWKKNKPSTWCLWSLIGHTACKR